MKREARDIAALGIGERIAELRRRATPPYTQARLAEAVGIKRSRLAQYEAERTRPPKDVATKIAETLGVPAALLASEAHSPVIVEQVKLLAAVEIRRWVGVNAALSLADDDVLMEDGTEVIPEVFLVGGAGRAERHDVACVSGPSMSPRVESGERVLIYRESTSRPNVIWLAGQQDGRAYLKVLRSGPKGYELHSINPEGLKVTDLTGWRLIGYAIAIFGNYEAGARNIEWNDGRPLRA